MNYEKHIRLCRANVGRLVKSASMLRVKDPLTASFLLDTATEEIHKSCYCIFVQRGWMNEAMVSQSFKSHDAKTLLYFTMGSISSDGQFKLENGEAFIAGQSLKTISASEWKNLIKKYEQEHRIYMNRRNSKLYIDEKLTFPTVPSEKELQTQFDLVETHKLMSAMLSVPEIQNFTPQLVSSKAFSFMDIDDSGPQGWVTIEKTK
jgi:hypothetical protein